MTLVEYNLSFWLPQWGHLCKISIHMTDRGNWEELSQATGVWSRLWKCNWVGCSRSERGNYRVMDSNNPQPRQSEEMTVYFTQRFDAASVSRAAPVHSRELKLSDEDQCRQWILHFKWFIWYKASNIFSVDVELWKQHSTESINIQ